MLLYESNKRLAIIRRTRHTFIRLPLFSFLRMQPDATSVVKTRSIKKTLENRINGNFLIHTNSKKDLSLYTYHQTRSIFRYVKRVKNAWNQESKVKVKPLQKNKEPISKRYDNWAALLALTLIKLID